MLSFYTGSWLYDRDPLEPLRFEEPLARLRSRLAAGEPVFENLIKKYLLENGHKVSVKVIVHLFTSTIVIQNFFNHHSHLLSLRLHT